MQRYDETLIKKVPIDFEVKKIGFILLPPENESLTNQSPTLSTKCHICNRNYMNRSNLKRHLDTVHAKKIFECEVCKENGTIYIFENQRKLSYHKRIHNSNKRFHPKQQQPEVKKIVKLECGLCGEEFSDVKELEHHKESLHQSVPEIDETLTS
jgi:ribosomal protein L31